MLPLSLMRTAIESPVLVELKSGETYNGRLTSCDAWMNMNLSEVIFTSSNGDRFFKLPTCYIRGSAIKYLRMPPSVLDKAVVEERTAAAAAAAERQRHPGVRGGGGRSARGEYRDGGRGGGRGRGSQRGSGRGGYRGGGRGRSAGGRLADA